MSKKSWEMSWGKLVPLLQTKTTTKIENRILDKKILHQISHLILSGADINEKSPTVQCTFLHLCIGKGLIKSSQFLLKKGADIHLTNLFHETPYQYIQYAPMNKKELEQLFIKHHSVVQINKKTR